MVGGLSQRPNQSKGPAAVLKKRRRGQLSYLTNPQSVHRSSATVVVVVVEAADGDGTWFGDSEVTEISFLKSDFADYLVKYNVGYLECFI
jgi:hypothetical protein